MSRLDPGVSSWGQAFAYRTGFALVVMALVVWLGWHYDVAVLRSVFPGANSMTPVSAVAFLLAGLALLNRCGRTPQPVAGALLSTGVATIGLASLLALAMEWSLPSDHWFPDPDALARGRIPGRMSALTASGFALLGALGVLGALSMQSRRATGWLAQQVLAMLILAIAMFALASFGYLGRVGLRVGGPDLAPVAIHTAMLFLAAALAWLGCLPSVGLMRVVRAPDLGGLVARRLLLPALLLPSLLGLLARVAGNWLSWNTTTVVSMLALVSGGAMAALIWWVALLLGRLERERAATLRDESHTDPLTGLSNRPAFDEALARMVRGRREHDRSFALLMLDLDRFKDYNDAHGHVAGDEVLRRVARLLRGALRPGDMPSRYGGEEFALLLPDTSGEEARQVGERIVQAFRDSRWPGRPVTASIGLAAAGREEDATAVVGRADIALYAAKAAGRDRLALAQ